MGELKQLQGDREAAVEWTVQAIELSQRLGETVAQSSGYQQLGELWASAGNVDGFDACYDRALDILDAARLPERRAECVARYQRIRAARSAAASPAS
jgi:hypothetical protein